MFRGRLVASSDQRSPLEDLYIAFMLSCIRDALAPAPPHKCTYFEWTIARLLVEEWAESVGLDLAALPNTAAFRQGLTESQTRRAHKS